MLKVLLHSIGILVHYNWRLPYYTAKYYDAKPAVLFNLLQMLMGDSSTTNVQVEQSSSELCQAV